MLLPRCDLIITHAGFNTAMAALDAGLPVLATPLAADQFKNASFLERLGVARVLAPDKCTPETLRAAALDMLADPRYRETAARQRAELATLPGLGVSMRRRATGGERPRQPQRAASIDAHLHRIYPPIYRLARYMGHGRRLFVSIATVQDIGAEHS